MKNNHNIGIYGIISPSNKIYIGQSTDIKRRWREYKAMINCKGQILLYRSFIKHGVENHSFFVIIKCSTEELNKYERYYQDYYYNQGCELLNLKFTSTEDKSGYLSDETKIKMCKPHKKFSKETRIKMSESKKGNTNKKNKKGTGRIVQQFDLDNKFIKETNINIFINEGFDKSSISKCCLGKRKSYKNFKFKLKKMY